MNVDTLALVHGVIDAALDNPDKAFVSKNSPLAADDGTGLVQTGCRYFYENLLGDLNHTDPCCIVGHAMVRTGQEALVEHRWENGSGAYSVIRPKIEGPRLSDTDRARLTWMKTVQSFQDQGIPWGQAVLNAGPVS